MDRHAVAAAYAPAARQALESFDVAAAALDLVHMAENVTFRVTAHDGTRYVLRLHRPGYHTLDELVSERVWIAALDQAGIAVPPPVKTRDGSDYVTVSIAATGERRHAGLTHWIEGELLADVLKRSDDAAVRSRCFEQLGEIVATLHNQASTWRPPPSFRRHALDRDGLMGDTPFWGPFWDHAALTRSERGLLLSTRARVREALDRIDRDPATWSLIHADLHPGNVLVDGGRLAVIDFDDTGFGWHHYDIAVALIHQQGTPDAGPAEVAFLKGYRALRPFPEAEHARLPLFSLIRGMVQIGWYHQRPEIKPASFDALKAFVLDRCAAFRWDS
jgi:Ser/Thr protein kinase RdoA (MazF antagonist)